MGNPLTEQIAKIIEQMIEENGGELELQRNKLANTVGCVPSQINYVITSRFNASRGYIVESRRGGGGFVKISKIIFDGRDTHLMHSLGAVGNEIDAMSARALLVSLYENEILSARELKYIYSAISDSALGLCPSDFRDIMRAEILKSVLLTIRRERQ